MRILYVHDFLQWRSMARECLHAGIEPARCDWRDGNAPQLDFMGSMDEGLTFVQKSAGMIDFKIPPAFLALAEKTACHRSGEKWALLYRVLWRLTHGEKHLLAVASDPDMRRISVMAKQVSRDAHKAKAFVRFRKIGERDGRECFAAWHCPDHKILPLVAPFFQRRFGIMDWTIMTPDQSVSWNGERLVTGEGVPADQAPPEDAMEDVWRTFYRAIFNPARVKIKMMKQEMPVRHWRTLPETRIIPSMLQEAPDRVAEMIRHSEGFARTAAAFMPDVRTIHSLGHAAQSCEGCSLHCHATQTVFGAGPANARLMIVGEQPGEQEDETGLPFVGPAGQILMRALMHAGIKRDEVYVTNAVKHFKFIRKDGGRIHQSPSAREINACKPWLEAEIEALRPRIIVGLGLTAAKALTGHGFKMKEGRGKWIDSGETRILITYHPSAVLRAASEETGDNIYAHIQEDLKAAQQALRVNSVM